MCPHRPHLDQRLRESKERRRRIDQSYTQGHSFVLFSQQRTLHRYSGRQPAPCWRDLEAPAPPQIEHHFSQICITAHIIVGSTSKHIHRIGIGCSNVKLHFQYPRLLFQVVEEVQHSSGEVGGLLPRMEGKSWKSIFGKGLGCKLGRLGVWIRSVLQPRHLQPPAAHPALSTPSSTPAPKPALTPVQQLAPASHLSPLRL